MSLGRRMLGFGRFALLVVPLVFSVAACSDDIEDDDDDEDGGGGTGGTFGGGSTTCAQYCQRLAACPEGPDPMCEAGCAETEDLADASGCASEFDRLLACLGRIDVCNPPADACSTELLAASDCVDGGTPAGCPPTGTGPANGDCVAACQRSNACAGAEQLDCAQSCADATAQAQAAGCTLELQRLNGCVGACTNICATTGDECSTEIIDYVNCMSGGGV